jgi:photosystem II stability/assembly factor-like uncharacterized protein
MHRIRARAGRPRTPRAGAVPLLALAVAAAGFVDPLDRPAERSALAPRTLLTGVAAAGGRLVAVGPRGHVVRSDDGGARWRQVPVPVSTDLTAVRFVSPERGWAVGHDGVVLATTDGGRSWAKRLDGRALGPLPVPSFLDVWFDDERTGFAVGAFNLIVRTDDGGLRWRTWDDRTDNPKGLHLHAIARVAGDVWIAGEQGLLLRLDREGGRFRAVPTPYGGSFFGVTGTDRTVVVFGLRGNAFRSLDRGATWEKVETGTAESITGAATTGDGRIVLVTQGGEVLVSGDEGRRFRLVARGPPAAAVAAAGAGTLVLAGARGLRLEALR